jgi:GNAT superfamily N-acetyltransferase
VVETTEGSRFPFTLRSTGPDDEPAVLELLQLTLGEKGTTRKTSEYWHWKHVANPFGASFAVCAVEPEALRLAGLRTMMRWTFVGSGGAYAAARAVDTATHPDYQRRGIFSALTRFAIEELRSGGSAFIFNTPNRNSLPGYLKMGWRVVERWPVHVRPVRPLRTLLAALLGRREAAPPDPGAVGLQEWARFREDRAGEIEEVVRLHERDRARVGYRTDRSLRYLDWRYGSHPDARYGVHSLVGSDGRLEAFLVARPTRGVRGLRALVLTELFARDAAPATIRRLLRTALRQVGGDYWLAHSAGGTLERRALARSGFFPAPGRGYTWTAFPLNPSRPDPTLAGSWDLTLGELEIF